MPAPHSPIIIPNQNNQHMPEKDFDSEQSRVQSIHSSTWQDSNQSDSSTFVHDESTPSFPQEVIPKLSKEQQDLLYQKWNDVTFQKELQDLLPQEETLTTTKPSKDLVVFIQQLLENAAPRPNLTGIPDDLKAKIEQQSGYSLDLVRVHYNSDEPKKHEANAYIFNNDIYIAPGQEDCLEEELIHYIQQLSGKVTADGKLGTIKLSSNPQQEKDAQQGKLDSSVPKTTQGELIQKSNQLSVMQRNTTVKFMADFNKNKTMMRAYEKLEPILPDDMDELGITLILRLGHDNRNSAYAETGYGIENQYNESNKEMTSTDDGGYSGNKRHQNDKAAITISIYQNIIRKKSFEFILQTLVHEWVVHGLLYYNFIKDIHRSEISSNRRKKAFKKGLVSEGAKQHRPMLTNRYTDGLNNIDEAMIQVAISLQNDESARKLLECYVKDITTENQKTTVLGKKTTIKNPETLPTINFLMEKYEEMK